MSSWQCCQCGTWNMYTNIDCRKCDHCNHRCKTCWGIGELPTRSEEEEGELLKEFMEDRARECRERVDDEKKKKILQEEDVKCRGRERRGRKLEDSEIGGNVDTKEFEGEEWDGDEEEREEDALEMLSHKDNKK